MDGRLARIVLCDTSEAVCDGWRRMLTSRCGDLSVSVYHGTLGALLERECGGSVAVVSPGNSFGFLGGGFDQALCQQLGGEPFETWFRAKLHERYYPVGSATAVELGGGFSCGAVRYVVHVPTMVAPCRSVYDRRRCVATGYSRVFDAMWNALVSCPADVQTLVVPGLATGYAGVPSEVACKSMVFALRVFALPAKLFSRELQNVLIMHFLGCGYGGFFGERSLRECERWGISVEALQRFDASRDSIEDILPAVELYV
ncbi:hypothetical protein HG536_0A04050 [Torulaspora globosa]|uniref:Macro domain-containing protein n=1 Tax=Torulaspora globosa TaxID=48254 RepID=A0A7G3ZAQ1_9SACH|nr:uncharacterized protein HG536_0A04050 [Torulaspora globosa]QLL30587.1 hypothetical protein HG536_0A04050 [Torulaspora globosa]